MSNAQAWKPSGGRQLTNRGHVPETLAEFLCYLPSAQARQELEQFRKSFERVHGRTDLTRNYTSMWAPEKQEWLVTHYPTEFYQGLPRFVQEFVKMKMKTASAGGQLDLMPAMLIRLFVGGHMDADGGGKSR